MQVLRPLYPGVFILIIYLKNFETRCAFTIICLLLTWSLIWFFLFLQSIILFLCMGMVTVLFALIYRYTLSFLAIYNFFIIFFFYYNLYFFKTNYLNYSFSTNYITYNIIIELYIHFITTNAHTSLVHQGFLSNLVPVWPPRLRIPYRIGRFSLWVTHLTFN